ncbi:MAG: hydroxymethylbilane synthase [Spirochaetia bacterium]|nr:hydroxymethylbilane synthase [Spirochaetia bacterium]
MKQNNMLRIGSRGSDLALAQAHYIKKRLDSLQNGPKTEIIIIKTTGDKIQDIPLSQLEAGNTGDDRKGFFTKEIEEALLKNEIDIAVHSYKDMPTLMPEGLTIGCMPQRLNPLDVIVFHRDKKTSDLPPYIASGSTIGTSSVRRISHIEFSWPDMKISPLRGNVPTRIKKLLDGNEFDAILLSGAGVERLKGLGFFDDFDPRFKELEFISLPPEVYVSAPAQGALAIQCRENDERSLEIIQKLEDAFELETVRAERIILKELNGGCHLPLGTHCIRDGNYFRLHTFLGKEAVDNRKGVSYTFNRSGNHAEELALEIVSEIKSQTNIVLTGRKERTDELKSVFGEAIHALPLIVTSGIDAQTDELKKWLSELNPSGKRSVLAVFSVPGAEHLKRTAETNSLNLSRFEFAVTGGKTKEALEKFFPDIPIPFLSPDGTGNSLAEMLIENKNSLDLHLAAVCAENPRKEFYETAGKAGFRITRIPVYRTQDRQPEPDELLNLPERSRIVFASPSAVRAFFKTHNQEIQKQKRFLFCALGPTTENEIQSSGFSVYAKSAKPDLDILLKDIL